MRMKPVLATIVAGALTFFGLQTMEGAPDAVADSTEAAESREVIEGVVFLSGPVAEDLGASVDDVAPEVDLDDYRAEVATILDDLEAQEPGLLDELAASYQSGDPVLVSRAMERTDEALTTWLESEFTEEELAAMGDVQPMACSLAVACVLYAAVAVHNTVGVTFALIAGAAVYLRVGFWSDGADGTGDALARDRFVVTVAETLAR